MRHYPLIALYSGARLQEICQLYVSDLKLQGNIWLFDFNEDGHDKLLKNSSSKRKTPIHPKLIELGLLDYRSGQLEAGQKRLFPDLPLANDGTYSSTFSKRFNFFLKRFNIKTDKTRLNERCAASRALFVVLTAGSASVQNENGSYAKFENTELAKIITNIREFL